MMLFFLLVLSLAAIFHAYLGYPFSLYMIAIFRSRRVQKRIITPPVSFIITAHNEERRIEEKIQNTLQLEYPREALQILVVSDGSSDRTNEIVRGFSDPYIELLDLNERAGKENAQKQAIQAASGAVLVFSDVATRIDPLGLKEIVSNFADPTVGCVSSEDRLISTDGKPSGEGVYVRYEMWLRGLESRVNSLVGLSGSFFAARSEVLQDFSGDMQSDFRTLLNSIKLGLRGVSDPRAIGYYLDVGREDKEFERKVRTVIRGLTVFFNHTEFLRPSVYGLFAYQYFCHKLLRWSVPFLLILALLANLALAVRSAPLFVLLMGQLSFYAAALAGWICPDFKERPYIKVPVYFVVVNLSILMAWFRYLKGDRIVMWQPSKR